jgi:hypothetical protein
MADTWSERISTSTELETESSFQGRVEMSKASMRIVENDPLLGGGFDVIYVPQVITKYIPSNLEPRAIHVNDIYDFSYGKKHSKSKLSNKTNIKSI